MGSVRIWGHKRYRAMGATSMGPWGDTAMGCRAMGSCRIWDHRRYRAMGGHSYGMEGYGAIKGIGPWGHVGYGAVGTQLWGAGIWGHVGYGVTKGIGPWGDTDMGPWGHSYGVESYGVRQDMGP